MANTLLTQMLPETTAAVNDPASGPDLQTLRDEAEFADALADRMLDLSLAGRCSLSISLRANEAAEAAWARYYSARNAEVIQ